MKNSIKFSLIAVMFAICTVNTANAQIFSKLKKSVEDKVEKTIIKKTSDKAAKKTEKALDEVLEPKLEKGKEGKKNPASDLKSSYDFKYKYRLSINTSKEKNNMEMDYYLKPGATYMGVKMNYGPDMFMIIDGLKNINYMFMDIGNNKIVTSTSIDSEKFTTKENHSYDDYKITDLPNKKFLEYDCIGKKMENKEHVFIMYFTNDAPISFNEVFKSDSERIPAAIKNHMKGNEKATMMYLEMQDKLNKGKKNKSSTIECTLLEPTNFNFDTAGYKKM